MVRDLARADDDGMSDTSGSDPDPAAAATATASDPHPPPPFRTPPRRLTRSRTHRRIGGVAGGCAEHLGVDPTPVRIVFVILGLAAAGAAVVAYAVAWLVLPEPGEPETPIEARLRRWGISLPVAMGAAVVLLAAIALDNGWGPLVPFGHDGRRLVGPIVLICGGLFLLLRRPDDAATLTPSAPATTARTGSMPLAQTGVTPPVGPDAELAGDTARPDVGRPPWVERAPRPVASPVLRRATLGAAFLFAAIAMAVDASGAAQVRATTVIAGMLLIVAAGVLVSGWWGRRRGLLGAAAVLAAALGVASVPGLSLAGGIGNRLDRPTTRADLPASYRLGIGEHEVDLRGLALPSGTTRLRIQQGIGRLVVRVRPDVEVVLSGHLSAGQVRIDDESVGLDGVDVAVRERLAPSGGPAADRARLDLRVDGGVGDVEVYHRVA
ncbi:MAG: phage shock protein PspC [Acidimicrobiales bacterium]|nr:phage shock protein PspC [Acidimicrobiales bacterium]